VQLVCALCRLHHSEKIECHRHLVRDELFEMSCVALVDCLVRDVLCCVRDELCCVGPLCAELVDCLVRDELC